MERNIIFLIMQGYSDEEIGEKLGYTRQYINRKKKKYYIPTVLNKPPMAAY
uniref:hypothetical protein n=1 Tax=Enterocloster clostridioformis TaxID=1531 RepID=UPI002674ED11|nr:hypothetical protein [Enterocloster clostridioformis]